MISVLMATYNKARFLDNTLAGYQNQSCKDFELVIVDDGSTDETRNVVKKYSDKINIKYCPQEKIGISRARSATLENASNDYLVITDDDRIPCVDFIKTHKQLLEKGEKKVYIGKEALILSYYHPEIKFKYCDEYRLYTRFPELLSGEEKQLFCGEDVLNHWDKVLEDYFLSDYTESYILELVKVYGEDLTDFHLGWSRAYGGNMSFDRSFCTQEVYYDHNYKGYGIEDTDFSYQLFKQGFHFSFSSEAINYHQEHKRRFQENREAFLNFQYFCKKYPDPIVKIMKMDWEGKTDLFKGNDFYNFLIRNKAEFKENIIDILNEK